MRDIFVIWGNTKMVVLVALIAAIYAVVLIPFKPIPLIPGFTEIRLATCIPVVAGVLFGPAAAWGAAFGNLIGDFFGTLGPGSIFGFFGNFLFGYIPYKLMRVKEEDTIGKRIPFFIFSAFISSLCCGLIVGWGVDLLGAVPFAALANIIWFNNFLVSSILGTLLLLGLFPRIRMLSLLYSQVMEGEDKPKRFRKLGMILLIGGVISGILVGNLISIGIYRQIPFGFGFGVKGGLSLAIGVLPFIIILVIGILLL